MLSSPKFLYRVAGSADAQLELASRLSFFLWGSTPDAELIELARKGELSKPDVLNRTIDRMFADPRCGYFS